MRCKLIKEYAQLLRDDYELWKSSDHKLALLNLICIVIDAPAETIKSQIENYKLKREIK